MYSSWLLVLALAGFAQAYPDMAGSCEGVFSGAHVRLRDVGMKRGDGGWSFRVRPQTPSVCVCVRLCVYVCARARGGGSRERGRVCACMCLCIFAGVRVCVCVCVCVCVGGLAPPNASAHQTLELFRGCQRAGVNRRHAERLSFRRSKWPLHSYTHCVHTIQVCVTHMYTDARSAWRARAHTHTHMDVCGARAHTHTHTHTAHATAR